MSASPELRSAPRMEAKELQDVFARLNNGIKKANLILIRTLCQDIPNRDDLSYIVAEMNSRKGTILDIANRVFVDSLKEREDYRRVIQTSKMDKRKRTDPKLEALEKRCNDLAYLVMVIANGAVGKYPSEICQD